MNFVRYAILPLIALPMGIAFGGDEPHNGPLQVQLKVELVAYPIGGSLPLEVRIVNSGPEPVVVYGNLFQGMVLEALASDGTTIVPKGFTHHHEICPPPPPKPNDFVTLQPGHFLGHSLDLSLETLGIDSPGTYSIIASYWIRVISIDSELFPNLMHEPIQSSPLKVTVVAKSKK